MLQLPALLLLASAIGVTSNNKASSFTASAHVSQPLTKTKKRPLLPQPIDRHQRHSPITNSRQGPEEELPRTLYKPRPQLTHNGSLLFSNHFLRTSSPSMRPFLPSPRYLTRSILSKAVHQMGSIVASRELRTLAQVPQLALSVAEDDAEIRAKYRPFLLDPEVEATDWISQLELDTVMSISSADIEKTGSRLKVLVLYGSLRKRSYSKLMAFEASRILHRLGCDVRIFNPSALPIRDSVLDTHPSVQELRSLSAWSDGHVWVTPEQHGNLTAVFKNQIDWIPLSTGSVRPTQGRTLSIVQINGGSQSFNALNSLRILGRWMRMWTIPNQSSLPMAYKNFEDEGGDGSGKARLLPSGNRERLVDCMEEFVKFTVMQRPYKESFGDRFSERKERREREEKRRLAEIAEKEKELAVGGSI